MADGDLNSISGVEVARPGGMCSWLSVVIRENVNERDAYLRNGIIEQSETTVHGILRASCGRVYPANWMCAQSYHCTVLYSVQNIFVSMLKRY